MVVEKLPRNKSTRGSAKSEAGEGFGFSTAVPAFIIATSKVIFHIQQGNVKEQLHMGRCQRFDEMCNNVSDLSAVLRQAGIIENRGIPLNHLKVEGAVFLDLNAFVQ